MPVFVLVMTIAIYSVVRFRAKPGDLGDGAPIHGNTRLEVIWVTIPFLMVTALAIYGWIVLDDIEAKQQNEMVVNVTGQQFTWTFEYPAEKVERHGARAPGGPPGRVQDPHEGRDPLVLGAAVPAEVGRRARPHHQDPRSRPTGWAATRSSAPSCAALGHSTMRQFVRVLPAAEFDSWVSGQKQGRGGGGGGRRRWRRRQAAGPNGEELFTSARLRRLPHARGGGRRRRRSAPTSASWRTRTPPSSASRSSTRTPRSTKGYQDGIMPQNFGEQLSKEELDALVKYLLEAQE